MPLYLLIFLRIWLKLYSTSLYVNVTVLLHLDSIAVDFVAGPVLASDSVLLHLLYLPIFASTYNLVILICCIIFLFPLSIPDVIYLLPSNFNLSQMLEFGDSLFLFSEAMSVTTRTFLLSLWLVHVKLLSLTFEILNGSPIKFVNLYFSSFTSNGISSILISWMLVQ